MKKQRITAEEIFSAARQKGFSTLAGIDLIILETTGDTAIIEKITDSPETTFKVVQIKPQPPDAKIRFSSLSQQRGVI